MTREADPSEIRLALNTFRQVLTEKLKGDELWDYVNMESDPYIKQSLDRMLREHIARVITAGTVRHS